LTLGKSDPVRAAADEVELLDVRRRHDAVPDQVDEQEVFGAQSREDAIEPRAQLVRADVDERRGVEAQLLEERVRGERVVLHALEIRDVAAVELLDADDQRRGDRGTGHGNISCRDGAE